MRSYFKRWYRRPRTTQERRATPSGFPYARAGRNMKNLPNAYDDIGICHQKSWKKKRKTQYYVGGRGEAKTIYIYIDASSEYITSFRWAYKDVEWTLKEFLDNHNIPYVAETIKSGELRWSEWQQKYWVWHRTVGYKITYWSKKDLSKALTFLGIGV